jgi:hypothetical protein
MGRCDDAFSNLKAYIEVLSVEFAVLRKVVVFLCHEHSFTEEIFVDFLAVSFWDEPVVLSVSQSFSRWCTHTLSRVPGAIRGIAYNVEN